MIVYVYIYIYISLSLCKTGFVRVTGVDSVCVDALMALSIKARTWEVVRLGRPLPATGYGALPLTF